MAIYFPVLSLSLSLWAARSAVTAFVFRSTLRVLYSFPISSAGRRRYSLGPINKRPHFVCLLVFANGMAARSNDDRPHFFLIIITEFSRHCHGLDRVLARNAETHRCGVRLFLAIDGVVLAWPGHTCPVAATPDVDGSCCRAAIVNLRWAASNKKKKTTPFIRRYRALRREGGTFGGSGAGIYLAATPTPTKKKRKTTQPVRTGVDFIYVPKKRSAGGAGRQARLPPAAGASHFNCDSLALDVSRARKGDEEDVCVCVCGAREYQSCSRQSRGDLREIPHLKRRTTLIRRRRLPSPPAGRPGCVCVCVCVRGGGTASE